MKEEVTIARNPALLDSVTNQTTGWVAKVQSLGQRWKAPLLIFLLWRLWLIPVSFVGGVLLPHDPRTNDIPLFPHPPLDIVTDRVLGIWGHWDGEWFLYLVQVGYRPGDESAPYFPLYPLLVKIVAWPLGGNFILAGPLVATLLGLATFIIFFELVKYEFETRVATRALICLAVYPTAFFLVACYSEGTFLTMTLAAFLCARRYRNWPLVGLFIGLASLSRNMGIWLMLPLGWEWAAQNWQLLPKNEGRSLWQRLNVPWRKLFSLPTLFFVGVPLLCFGSLLLFEWIALGNPFQFVKDTLRPGWDRHPSWPWQTLGYIFALFGQNLLQNPAFLELIFFLFVSLVGLIMLYQTWRRQWRISYLIMLGIALLLPLSAIDPAEPLVSFPRYSLLAFPVFIVLGRGNRRKWLLVTLYLILGFLLLSLFMARFANWLWVA